MRDFLGAVLLRIKNSSLQTKLFFSYFILMCLPILTLSAFSYHKISQVATEKSMDISRLYLLQTQSLLDAQLTRMANISQVVSQDTEIRRLLETEDISFSEEFDAIRKLNNTITNIRALYDIDKIRLYISPEFRYSRSNDITYDISTLYGETWYQEMLTDVRTTAVRPPYVLHAPLQPDEEYISVVTLIRSYRDMREILGVVSVDMPVRELSALLSTADFTHEGFVALVDREGGLICRHGKGDFENRDSLWESAMERFPEGSGVMSENGLTVGLSAPLLDDWRILSVLPTQSLFSESGSLWKQLLLVAALVGAAVYMLGYFYARHNTKRVRELVNLMNQAERGDFSVKCVVDCEDEIGELQSSFNFMVSQVSTLLGERYNLGKSLKETELKALQAQINPHFLYNTLDLISWKAQKGGNPEISDIVCKMARFYQLSLSSGSDFIRLADEFSHIRLYVELQNLRFERPVRLDTQLSPEAADCRIMKLLLQPIVENSIAHGILDREGPGVIRIAAGIREGSLYIRVEDNGIGMEKAKLTAIRSRDKQWQVDSSGHGFGLLNVIDRLKVYYNDRYSFDISSTVGQGTVVSICIPADIGS